MTNQSGGTPSGVTVHFSLLCSSLAVVLAVVAGFMLSVSSAPISLVRIIITLTEIVVLLLAFIYAGYELFITIKIGLQNPGASSGVCTSAFLGSFLLGVIVVLLATMTEQSAVVSDGAIIVSIVSLGGLLFFRADKLPEPPFHRDTLHEMPQPHLPSRLFYVVKEGEDACAISQDENRFALSDGAGASSLPRPWASLLGLQWIAKPFDKASDLVFWLEEPRQNWEQWVQKSWLPAVNKSNQVTRDYPVRQEEVMRILERGAAATFLGVEISRQSHQWRAIAIGDTCLFIIRQTPSLQLIPILPIKKSAEFNLTPPLLSSHRDDDANALVPYLKSRTASYREGDLLLMATDALAQWLFVQYEQLTSNWLELLSMESQQDFMHFVEQQRQEGMMLEDDTTLLIIQL